MTFAEAKHLAEPFLNNEQSELFDISLLNVMYSENSIYLLSEIRIWKT